MQHCSFRGPPGSLGRYNQSHKVILPRSGRVIIVITKYVNIR